MICHTNAKFTQQLKLEEDNLNQVGIFVCEQGIDD